MFSDAHAVDIARELIWCTLLKLNPVSATAVSDRPVTRFAIVTVCTFDLDSGMETWLSGHSQPIRRKLQARADIAGVQRIFATCALA